MCVDSRYPVFRYRYCVGTTMLFYIFLAFSYFFNFFRFRILPVPAIGCRHQLFFAYCDIGTVALCLLRNLFLVPVPVLVVLCYYPYVVLHVSLSPDFFNIFPGSGSYWYPQSVVGQSLSPVRVTVPSLSAYSGFVFCCRYRY